MTPSDAHAIASAFDGVYRGVMHLGMSIDGCTFKVPDNISICNVDAVPHDAKVWTKTVNGHRVSHEIMLLCRDIARQSIHDRGIMFYRQRASGSSLSADAPESMLPCRVELLGTERQTARVTVLTRQTARAG